MILEKIKKDLLKELLDWDVSIASIGFSYNCPILCTFSDKKVLHHTMFDMEDYAVLRDWYEQICNAYGWIPYKCDMEDIKYKFSELSEEKQIYLKMKYR